MSKYPVRLLACLLMLVSISCEESLPEYAIPERSIEMNVTLIEQLPDRVAPPWKQKVRFQVEGQNVYSEVFQDSAILEGVVRIWWKRRPYRYRTINLTKNNLTNRNLIHNGQMTLIPGQKFIFEFLWDIKGDDGYYFPGEMDFSFMNQRLCAYNVVCASPEEMIIESSFVIFNRLGTLVAPAKSFIFIGKNCNDIGYPPCPGNQP